MSVEMELIPLLCFGPARVRPNKASIQPKSAEWRAQINNQYASNPDRRADCYAEIAVSSLPVAENTAGNHCTYPQRDGQAEWAWVAWIILGW